MRLLLMHEWSGPSRAYEPKPNTPEPKVQERQVTFITGLPIGKALRRIRAYEDAFKERYGYASAVYEFKLLSVSDLGAMTPNDIELTRADLVETLAKTAADFGA